jgi:phosphoribosylglycinamide formyltransferase-1
MSAQRAKVRTAVLVSGSGSNLQAIMDRTVAGELPIEIVGVVSDRPEAFALERAKAAGLPALAIDYATAGGRAAFAEQLSGALDGLRADLVVLAGFMRIIAEPLVVRHRGRMLNVHPSLLPRYPGLDTYRRVLEAGDEWHGSTVHFVTTALDSGPAIIQYRLRVRRGDDERKLRERVQRGEHVIYPRAIGWVASGRVDQRDDGVWMDGRPLRCPVVVDEV